MSAPSSDASRPPVTPVDGKKRRFLQVLAGGGLLGGLTYSVPWWQIQGANLLAQWRGEVPPIAPWAGQWLGASVDRGHLLRQSPPPITPHTANDTVYDVLIVGGGVAGLAVVDTLCQHGQTHFKLLELEDSLGGNARAGSYQQQAFPLAAHYVPLVNEENSEVRTLFEQLGIITGYQTQADGRTLPIYNEYYLCAAPQERLHFKGRWQEDLWPSLGVDAADQHEYARFHAHMDAFKQKRGRDGRWWFSIPVDDSSTDAENRALDTLTMQQWMHAQGYRSRYVYWYVDYGCRDDFGTAIHATSAWAGIHYFAGRRGKAANAPTDALLTWPEGNAWLVRALVARIKAHAPTALQSNAIVRQVQFKNGVWQAVYSTAEQPQVGHTVYAKKIVLAVPQFVAYRLLGKPPLAMDYAPWVTANIALNQMPLNDNVPLSWDNVAFASNKLGYVVATHQLTQMVPTHTVLTYYWALSHMPPHQARQQLYTQPLAYWQHAFVNELLQLHPELKHAIARVDVARFGHAMVRPTPHTIWGAARQQLHQLSTDYPHAYYAHADKSGMSIFEEAYTQGVRVAKQVLGAL